MKFCKGLIIGFISGGIFGVFIMALCIAQKNAPLQNDKEEY